MTKNPHEVLFANRVKHALTPALLDQPQRRFRRLFEHRALAAGAARRGVRRGVDVALPSPGAVAAPRIRMTSASVLPASVRSKPQLASCTFFGSPPPRSVRMISAVSPRIFARVAGSRRRCEHALASAFLRPARQQRRLHARARRGVGILIDRRVHAARPRLVDRAQRLDAAAPVRGADHLVMRHLRRQAALLADRDRLLHAVEHLRRFLAHVRDVDAAVPSRDARQRRHFRRRSRTSPARRTGRSSNRTRRRACPARRAASCARCRPASPRDRLRRSPRRGSFPARRTIRC